MILNPRHLAGGAKINPDPSVGSKPSSETRAYEFVPVDGVGELVQSCLEAGMKRVTITPNKGGGTCTMIVES